MATKWKNTINGLPSQVKRNKQLIIAITAGTIAVLIIYYLFKSAIYYGGLPTRSTLLIGIVSNILLSMALWMGIEYFLRFYYDSWIPEDESFYTEWQKIWQKQQKVLAIIFGVLFLFAILLFINIMNFYTYNYASGYVMILTVLIQAGVVEVRIIRYMKDKLNLLMNCMTQINQKNLQAALEIEKKSIEASIKSEQLKVDLISNVSHDLKTPLTSMVGYIELLKKEELNDAASDYVDVLSNKTEKLKEMIESLFSLAKASSGNIELHPEPLHLNRLLDQILADMSDQIQSSTATIVHQMTEDDTTLVTDNLHLYRICQNLIGNALKYSARNTRIFIKTWIKRNDSGTEQVCMEIANTSGYPMDFHKEDILERFARGDKSRSGDGNGLGLAIVSTYTSALKGSFDISIDYDQFKATIAFPREAEIS